MNEPAPISAPLVDRGWREPAARVALGLAGVLILLTLLRAIGLGGEYYDAYEVRAGGRALAGLSEGGVPVYRSPLLLLASAAFETLGCGWRGPALVSALSYGALILLVIGIARRLGADPWVAASAGLLAGLDRLAWAYAPHGVPGVAVAASCAAVLWLALAPEPDDEPGWPVQPLVLGALIGVTALLRPNAGLVGLALLAGLRRGPGSDWRKQPLTRIAAAAGVAVGVYLLVFTVTHALARGSLSEGWAAHGDLLAFQREQMAENRARYGGHAPWGSYLASLAISSPLLLLGALVGLARGRALRGVRVLAAWACLHLLFLSAVAGHVEARYLLPALAALAGLCAVGLQGQSARLPTARARTAAVLALAAVPLLAGGGYEIRRTLDPITRHSRAASIAAAADRVAGADGRFLWTTTHPFPLAPAVVLEQGSPYPGDPFHGIYHAGPVVLGYHLGRPVAMLQGAGAGLVDPAELEALVSSQAGLRAGDVLLVGRDGPSAHWDLEQRPSSPISLWRVVERAGGLGLEPAPLAPDGPSREDRPR